MQKVWILERWNTREEMESQRNDFREMAEELAKDGRPDAYKTLEKFENILAQNPNGMWVGHEGKSNYKQFCDVAKDALRRAEGKGWKFRVVLAEIKDDAKFWVGYQNPVENEVVMRYLLATK